MLAQNMFCHLGVYRRSLIDSIGGFRLGYEGSQDYDLVLRAQSVTSADPNPAYPAYSLPLAGDSGLGGE